MNSIRVEKNILNSRAFRALSGSGKYIFFQFLIKRKFVQVNIKREKTWICTNCDELTFSYEEASRKHQYTATKFRRAIDELVKLGFIDLVKVGGRSYMNYTIYALSDRWEKYGTNSFVENSRSKICNSQGYLNKKNYS